MTTTLSAKLSADSGNQLSFGTDQGLFIAPPSTAVAGTYGWTIDNTWAASGAQWYYQLANASSALTTVQTGLAQIWPFVVTRTCRVTDAQIYMSVAGAAGSTFNVSVFQSNGTHGLPGTKLADLLRFPTNVTGFISPTTLLNSTQVFSANTVYWMASWPASTGAYPNIYQRQVGTNGYAGIRLSPGAPSGTSGYGQWAIACTDTTTTWSTTTSAPSSLTVNMPSVTNGLSSNNMVPLLFWGLTNS